MSYQKLQCNCNIIHFESCRNVFFLICAFSHHLFPLSRCCLLLVACHEAREEGLGQRGESHEDPGQLLHRPSRPVLRRTAGQDQDVATEEEERAGRVILKRALNLAKEGASPCPGCVLMGKQTFVMRWIHGCRRHFCSLRRMRFISSLRHVPRDPKSLLKIDAHKYIYISIWYI